MFSPLKPPLLVAMSPITFQFSMNSIEDAGVKKTRIVAPGGSGSGAPLASTGSAIRPIHVAWRLPLDMVHSPVTRWPPSTSSARDLTGGPQLSAPRGSPQILRAIAGSTAVAVAAQPLIWPTHHPVLPSSLPSASIVLNHVTR